MLDEISNPLTLRQPDYVIIHGSNAWKNYRSAVKHPFTDGQIDEAEKSGKSMGRWFGADCYVETRFPVLKEAGV